MSNPSLPQQDDPQQQASRSRSLAWARTQYTWAHSHTYEVSGKPLVLEPIAVLNVDADHPFPKSQQLDIVQIIQLGTQLLEIIGNVIVNITNLLNAGAVQLDPPPPASFMVPPPPEPKGFLGKLREAGEHALEDVKEVGGNVLADVKHTLGITKDVVEDVEDVKALLGRLRVHHESAHQVLVKAHATMDEAEGAPRDGLFRDLVDIVKKVFEELAKDVVKEILRKAGLFGAASNMRAFAAQFQTIVVPDVLATTLSDECFAQMRVAGPNPLLIAKIDALPSNFPVDAGRFERVAGQALDAALSSGRVYLVDYVSLNEVVGGTDPAGQKYISAPLALFVLSEDRQNLRPVAIQCSQVPGNSSPVFYADDGESWNLAKIHVQSADGNFHELVSHLGLTHLLIEPFVVATHRQLAQEHPLFLLLLPHFQGTLFINNAALGSLIAPGGPVDQLLAGTIQSDWKMTTNALANLDFNAHMLPANLASRGVDEPAVLPNYPYRDDALLVWKSISGWVHDYLSIYYNTDADVVGDSELQAWYRDLVSTEGGCVGGFGEEGPEGSKGIFTFGYLKNVVTMLIFTASAQHATVNFPQLAIMSYTPVMPLATYAPAPTQVSAELSPDVSLAALPPLEMALIQLVVGQLLGGIYFTRLGEYNLHQRAPWFADARVNGPLEAFQNNLAGVERTIGVRNQTRACYEPLLPSRIPQSINI